MASNNDLIDIKLGAWEWFIGSTNLGSLADEDVTIELDANVIKATSNASGKSTVKAWTGGTSAKVTLTLNHKHKDKLRIIFSHLLKNRVGQNSNAGNGNAGSFEVSSLVGECLRPFVLTGYLNHTLCEDGTRFINNNANPISIQITRAITPEALKWVFSTSDVATQEVVFEGMADLDNINNSVATIGFVALPSAILSGLAFSNLGAGYSSAPTIVFGINFVGSSAVTIGQYINTANRLYKVTIAGTMSATAPTHTSGTLANGTATLEYIGVLPVATVTVNNGQVVQNSVSISTFGSNVPSDLPVSFTGGGFTTVAVATVVTY